jgi:hypothetical protein
MKKIICVLAVTSLCGAMVAMPAIAQDRPSPEEARKVINYYFNGKGQGVIPMEYKLGQELENSDMDIGQLEFSVIDAAQ